MTTYIDTDPINLPDTQATLANDRFIEQISLWKNLDNTTPGGGVEKRAILYTVPTVNFRPTTIIMDDPTNTLIEVSADDPDTIALAGDVVWAAVANSSHLPMLTIAGPITAVRATNLGTGVVRVRIC